MIQARQDACASSSGQPVPSASGVFAAAHFEAIAAVDRLDVEDLAAGDAENALHGRRHVLVHAVRELDDDDGALARRPNQASRYGPGALSKLAKTTSTKTNLALSEPPSTTTERSPSNCEAARATPGAFLIGRSIRRNWGAPTPGAASR